MNQLEQLILINSQVTSKSFELVRKIKKLRKLDLSGANIYDSDIKDLILMAGIEFLELNNTKITDNGARLFKNMRSLKILSMKKTKVTPKIAKEIEQSLKSHEKKEVGVVCDGYEGVR